MSDTNPDDQFLDSQEDVIDMDEPEASPRTDLTYHAEARRQLEIRNELLQLQEELTDFDVCDKLLEDILKK